MFLCRKLFLASIFILVGEAMARDETIDAKAVHERVFMSLFGILPAKAPDRPIIYRETEEWK
jgi:hypothetical protein